MFYNMTLLNESILTRSTSLPHELHITLPFLAQGRRILASGSQPGKVPVANDIKQRVERASEMTL